jgi:hypothetical protein|nr:MAG TPA: hypothetical protein [Caudoviricetes sp.]
MSKIKEILSFKALVFSSSVIPLRLASFLFGAAQVIISQL